MSMRILQDFEVQSTSKTVDWLVNNTIVSTFNSVSFEGYQRKIDEKHCQGIVSYLQKCFILPTAIICACEAFTDEQRLRIVDGQHRVEAFKILRRDFPERYKAIESNQVPVIVLVGVPIEVEINTFITINKTSKKVDTSLAYVLRNKITREDDGANLALSRAEYLAVEVARKLNENNNEPWGNKILYEGAVKHSNQFISLNSFVSATRVLFNTIGKCGPFSISWSNEDEAQRLSEELSEIINTIWIIVYDKWRTLRSATFEERQIIQGSIGYTSITRTLVKLMKGEKFNTKNEFISFVSKVINKIDIDDSMWLPGGSFSKYSSGSGYKFVSEEMIKSMGF